MKKYDRVEFYKDAEGNHRWRYVSRGNGKILADSAEGYKRLSQARNSCTRVTGRSPVFIVDGKLPKIDAEFEVLAVKTDD